MDNYMKTIVSGIKTWVSGIKSDWNENDPSADGYIRNRPFYDYVVEKDLLQKITVNDFAIDDELYFAEYIIPFIPEIGETYTVYLDGMSYECLCSNINNYDDRLLGNPAIYNDNQTGIEDATKPFAIFVYNDGSSGGIITTLEGESHTVEISQSDTKVHKIDKKYLPDFSNVGKAGSGEGSEIFNDYSKNTASGEYSHAEGNWTTASGYSSHAEGYGTVASGSNSHAEGGYAVASGKDSHAEGYYTVASGISSHAEGLQTIANSDYQHVQGQYNIGDASGTYAHIVGNGKSSNRRSNAHTLDWDGNAWYAGGISSKGMLELAPYDNGNSRLFKNHSDTADYGTVIQDTDKNGNTVKLTLMANDGSMNFVDKDANIHKVLTTADAQDYVVAEGTSGIWYYRKMNSGIVECWGIAQSSTGAFDWWDSKSYLQTGASPVPRQSYPFTISNPRLTFSLYSLGDVSGFGIAETTQYNTTQYTPEIWTVLGSGVTGHAAMDVTVEYHVVGRWK